MIFLCINIEKTAGKINNEIVKILWLSFFKSINLP